MKVHVITDAPSPGPAMVKYAQNHKADLVVVGSRGLGSLKRGMLGLVGLGSVSDYMVSILKIQMPLHCTRTSDRTTSENAKALACYMCHVAPEQRIAGEAFSTRLLFHFVLLLSCALMNSSSLSKFVMKLLSTLTTLADSHRCSAFASASVSTVSQFASSEMCIVTIIHKSKNVRTSRMTGACFDH